MKNWIVVKLGAIVYSCIGCAVFSFVIVVNESVIIVNESRIV